MLDQNVELMLKDWRDRVGILQQEHFRKAGRSEKAHRIVGLPATILAVIITGIILWDFDKAKISDIFSAAISFIAAILVAIQTFYDFAKHANVHRSTSTKYGDARKEIDVLLSLPPETRAELVLKISELLKQISGIAEGAPLLDIAALTRDSSPRPRPYPDAVESSTNGGYSGAEAQSSGSGFSGPVGGGFSTPDSGGRQVHLPTSWTDSHIGGPVGGGFSTPDRDDR